MKLAVFSMDIEDWYHLDYFRDLPADRAVSLLDGVDRYCQILADEGIHSSFFTLGELVGPLKAKLRELQQAGHDVASHGWGHQRPLTMSVEDFRQEVTRARAAIEDATGQPALGFRAPCFSLDRERLDVVRQVGHVYDSSRILFGDHPLYGDLDVAGFEQVTPSIYRDGDFVEFQVSTRGVGKRQIPVSGGGYLRLFPWLLMRWLLGGYLRGGDLYTLYIHPFEMSPKATPVVPEGVGRATRTRFAAGRSRTPAKLRKLISLLRRKGYSFTTFAALRERLLGEGGDADAQ